MCYKADRTVPVNAEDAFLESINDEQVSGRAGDYEKGKGTVSFFTAPRGCSLAATEWEILKSDPP